MVAQHPALEKTLPLVPEEPFPLKFLIIYLVHREVDILWLQRVGESRSRGMNVSWGAQQQWECKKATDIPVLEKNQNLISQG